MGQLTLQLLGAVRLELQPAVDATPKPRKARALLGYLALHPEGASRDRLAALFWSNASEAQARTSLRQCLTALRRALGASTDELLEVDTDRVALRTQRFRTDALELLATPEDASAASLESAIASYRGPLLESLASDEAPFENWRMAMEQQLRDHLERLVVRAVMNARVAQDEPRALRLALGLVNVDWTREPAHRLVLEGYARTGQLATARAHFQRFREQLEQNLGTSPSEETVEVYRNLARLTTDSGTQTAEPEAEEIAQEQRRQVSACAIVLADRKGKRRKRGTPNWSWCGKRSSKLRRPTGWTTAAPAARACCVFGARAAPGVTRRTVPSRRRGV